MEISEAMLQEAEGMPHVSVIGKPHPISFDN